MSRWGVEGTVGFGMVRLGRQGRVWQGEVRPGRVWRGGVRQAWSGKVGLGLAR